MRSKKLRLAAFAIGSLVLVGCGGGASLQPVEGKVTLDGAPLARAWVSLVPKDAAALKDKDLQGPFVGEADEQGMFKLGPPGRPGEGAPAGEYTLAITTKHNASGDETAPPPVEKAPPPYSSPGVDFTVPAGGKTDANFDLKSK
jgi:hypothetical protein